MGGDCKSPGSAFEGSNPSPATSVNLLSGCLFLWRADKYVRKFLSLLFSGALLAASLTALSSTSALAETSLITCTDLTTQKTIVLKANQKSCKPLHAPAIWHIQQSDTSAHSGAGYATIRICSSQNPVFTYQYIKKTCPNYQVTTDYWRAVGPLEIPIIATISARGHDSAAFALTATNQATDAPIAYYLITNIKTGQIDKVLPSNTGELSLSNLSALTSYTFTIAAVSVDGTSRTSSITPVITTGAVPVAIVAPAAAPLAAPAFTLSSTAETKTANNAITGYTISSTGGTIASYAISPAAPAGTTFNIATGLLTGTPTATQSPTTYTITATNASGSATQAFTLTVSAALAAPAFTLTSSAETRTVNTAATGFTISSTGGAIASFAINATPPGMSFSTSTGALTGTPTSVAAATTYTVTAINASGSATRTFTFTVTANVYTIGDTGPGGGKVFYIAATPFACGPTRATSCTYLEAAPSGWNGGAADPKAKWSNASGDINNAGSPETATATAIGWGYRNTRAIILAGNTDTGTAAALADSYTVTVSGVVYDDWYLPSKDELNQMCKWERGITGTDLTTLTTDCAGGVNNTGPGAAGAGFGDFNYWSSSERDKSFTGGQAWIQWFGTGAMGGTNKLDGTQMIVRPVRAF